MGAYIYAHPVLFIGLLWCASSLVVVGLLGLILSAARSMEEQADEEACSSCCSRACHEAPGSMIVAVGRPVLDAEGPRLAPAFATPQGNWLATSDRRLTAVFRRLNDRAWARRWRTGVEGAEIASLPAGTTAPSTDRG